MGHNQQSHLNSSIPSSIGASVLGSSSSLMPLNSGRVNRQPPSFSNLDPNPPTFSPTWGSGNGNGIGSSSFSLRVSASNLSHDRVLVGFLSTNMVKMGNSGIRHIMIRLLRSKTTGYLCKDVIYAENITTNYKVGYIDGSVADVLAPLIDSQLISIQGIIKPLPKRYNISKIPCEVHVFAMTEMIDQVTYLLRNAGINFTSRDSEQFQLSHIAEMLGNDPPKTVNEIFALLNDKLSDESVLEPMEAPSNVISTELLPHQKEGLRWLFQRENTTDLPPFWVQKGRKFVNLLTLQETCTRPEPFRGGIFADDMGMGKTLTLLSLIATDKCEITVSSADDEPVIWTGHKFERKEAKRLKLLGKAPIQERPSYLWVVPSEATLIVCPASVLSSWVKELELHVRRGSLRSYLYHGERTKYVDEIKGYDIVLTTYCIVSSESSSANSPLKKVVWRRIILDEAHDIRNHSTVKSQAITLLNAQRKWVVTGTPIQNDSMDVYSLIAFLRIEPFTIKYWWSKLISCCILNGDSSGFARLQILIGSLSLRRMKNECLIGLLPSKSIETCYVDLSEEERKVYSDMKKDAKRFVRIFYSLGEHHQGANPLGLLTRLRQACLDICLCPSPQNLPPLQDVSSKPELVSRLKQLMAESEEEECPICLATSSSIIMTVCAHMFCQPCIIKALNSSNKNCPLCRRPLKVSDLYSVDAEASSSTTRFGCSSSSKTMALLKLLAAYKDEDPTIKSVVFSQFNKFLVLLEGTLKEAGFNVVRIDGSVPVKKRSEIIDRFVEPDGPTILLAGMKVASEGVNLNAASRVYLMEPWWNPAVEDQAMDRVHRIGQTKEVKIIRMIARDTIEQKILKFQENKKVLAQRAFAGSEVTESDIYAVMNM